MATYYSIIPDKQLSTGSNQTNVLNIPNDYLLNVGGGTINIMAKLNAVIEAGNNVEVYADTTDIFGEIRVRGTTPIGTAPVVSNVLYVTVDGNDSNDGRAMDASRACRTIGGAINSPYYESGTQILVSAGFYLEDNPLRMKPYTSIRGSDIRTTFIEPINKTQDLFHVESGCYLNYMSFLNGRSGLLEGPYATEFNRGAFATSFPPLDGDERIDLFHSPYIQNCTNQSGPWLKDGTMFIPNQTVQIPLAVGTGSWPANATAIVVNVTTGTVELGMSINAGQQNPGFFNARTLMLANKIFLQEQVVAYVDTSFNTGAFGYNATTCRRDISLILDSISLDVLYNSTSDSTFAGLQYWSQTTSAIVGQVSTTTAAITYLKGRAAIAAFNAGGTTPQNIVNTLFTTVTNIITNGTVGVTGLIVANGIASTNTATIAAYNALINNIPTFKDEVISWLTINHSTFVYNTSTCARDVSNIVQSVAFDLKHGGNKQSIKAGVYYYNYSSTASQIVSEVPQTTAAYNYLKTIILNIITGKQLPTVYQTATTQVISGQSIASTYEAEALKDRIDVITNIIRRGPDAASGNLVINLTINPSEEALHAFNILLANKTFIQNEIIAYIAATANIFQYSREYCYRDVGILVENIAYDAAFGGNQKAVDSGLSYYNGVISRISGQESQTSAGIDYLNELVQKIITNTTVTTILTVPIEVIPTGTHPQVINTVLIDGDVAADSIDKLFNIVVTIVNNGPADAPPIYKSTGPDAAFVSAEILMQANRQFIQDDTINYINNLIKSFPYGKAECKRDVGLIVDSISYDLLYPTATRSQSTFAGLQYWSKNTYTGNIQAQLGPTIDAVKYLKELSTKVIKNITTADDLVNRYQSVVLQNTSTFQSATDDQVTIINSNFNTVLEILNGKKSGWSDRIIRNGAASEFIAVQNAFNSLIANKAYLIAEVLAYINAVHPNFTYSTSTCARDVGLITNSIAFDLKHGGNRQSIQAGLLYYAASGSTSTIHGQESQTIVAFNRISTLASSLLLGNTPVASTGTKVAPILSIFTATSNEVNYVQASISTITNIITYGANTAPSSTSIGLTATTVTSVINAFNILQKNREYIIDDIISFIDWTYNPTSFNYKEEVCYRDIGLIVDAVSQDILLGGNYKSIEAGSSYWNKGYNNVADEVTTTTAALNYSRDIALKIIANIPVIPQTGTNASQIINTFFQYGGDYMPQEAIKRNFGIITTIIEKGLAYAPPSYAGGGLFSLTGINGSDVKISPKVTSVHPFTYSTSTCARDLEYIIDGVYYDTALATNYNSIISGKSYRLSISSVVINTELPQTISAINFAKAGSLTLMNANATAVSRATVAYNEIVNIIDGATPSAITFSNPAGGNVNQIAAKDKLIANKSFIQAETIAWIQSQIVGNIAPFIGFNYNSTTCSRDIGTIVDALCYDILYGGNSASRTISKFYFSGLGLTVIPGETLQSVAAFTYMKSVAQNVIVGTLISPKLGNVTQITSGNNATNTEATTLGTLVNIITNVITAGNINGLPAIVNPSISWAAAGIQTAVGLLNSGKTTLINNTIIYINTQFTGTVTIGLDIPTIGFGNNASLYFGDTLVFPKQDDEVEELSFELTGSTSTWNQRKVDPIGSMGGSLVDGKVISVRSPINSMVYDAFTQVNQGGRGIRITNDGYAQLVSVFTIFCSTGVEVINGGIASIVNSNANFGDLCLVAKGYGKRKFSGTVYNPINKSYPDDPEFNQFYPTGFWPNNARVRIFLPELVDRPHISLIMEIVPPTLYTDYLGTVGTYLNDQGFPGFLNAIPNLGVVSTGTITITNIDTTDIAIGNSLYIRDQFGSLTGSNGVLYAATGTIVTDLGYKSVTLNKALTSGGTDPLNTTSSFNTNYFNLYFCGNSYYTVLSSEVGDNPIPVGTNVLSTASTGGTDSQVPAHIAVLGYLNTLTNKVIKNETITRTSGNTSTQIKLPLVTGGGLAETFINQRFGNMISIINAATLASAESVVPPKLRTKTGPAVQGAGAAINLITQNLDFFVEEIAAYMSVTYPTLTFSNLKCRRDTKLIMQRLIYDIESGGRYNSVMIGLSYWQRDGTHHIVQLGENVTRPDLFPDGATVNFYQRSYMSASGYVFEYVGAGTNYGALPQVGRADPVQEKETVQLDSGKVFFTSTDQNGDFRIGPGLVISQATGVLSGRTFTKSLFANMTPFILAIEAG